MNICIAGYGFVGKAHEALLKRHYNIFIVDPKYNDNRVNELDVDSVIICVPTPQSPDGSCDMTHIHQVLDDTHPNLPVLIKSTISIEGWEELLEKYPSHSITFSPEYLRAANYENDMLHLKKIEFGGAGAKFWCDVFCHLLKDLECKEFDPRVLILNKYARNSFLATKVSWFNQLYDLCEAYDIDYQEVADLVSSDHRIGISHTDVTRARGWGGHCFPKDTKAFLSSAKRKGIDLSLLNEAVEYNNKIRS
jgi:UDPglucose 6-dehydrogenase